MTLTAQEALDRAVAAYMNAQEALGEFQMACQMGDWEAAEAAREVFMACSEAFMDNFAAGYRA